MCLEDQTTMMGARETFTSALGKCKGVRLAIKSVLWQALAEKRLTIGLLPAIQRLSNQYGEALFCLMAPSQYQDAATHMQEVLLEAFCLENDIYIVKVDSTEKLHKLLPGSNARDCNCVLIHAPYSDPYIDQSPKSNSDYLSPSEKLLAEHCENNWKLQTTPLIKLPEE